MNVRFDMANKTAAFAGWRKPSPPTSGRRARRANTGKAARRKRTTTLPRLPCATTLPATPSAFTNTQETFLLPPAFKTHAWTRARTRDMLAGTHYKTRCTFAYARLHSVVPVTCSPLTRAHPSHACRCVFRALFSPACHAPPHL